MMIKKKMPIKQTPINYSQNKKQFWEQVLKDQQITDLPQFNEQDNEQQSISTPRNEHIIQQFWFLQKFFLQYTLLNYTHLFHFVTFFKKEWQLFPCRNQQFHWNLLLLPLIFYQLSAYVSFKIQNMGLFIIGLVIFSSLNLMISIFYRPKQNLDQHMHETCLKLEKIRELFKQNKQTNQEVNEEINKQSEEQQQEFIGNIIKTTQNYYPNLISYNNLLLHNIQPKWCLTFFGLSFLLSFQIYDIYWEFTFSWLYGLLLEQLIRFSFCFIYSKKLTQKWILQGPDQVYTEMQILAEFYKPLMLISKSPQKYIMNDTHVNISGMSKDQSNLNILNHNSTHDLIQNKHQILRITSANLGTIEDTKLDITENVKELPILDSDQALDTEQNNNKQNLNQQTEMDTQPEDIQFKKKKVQRVKLEALYHSKVTNRSPKPNLPKPQFYSSQKNKQNQEEQNKLQEQEIFIQNQDFDENQKENINYEFIQFKEDINSPPPQFNPIDFLKNISPIGSQLSQRNEIPHQWEEPDEEEACNFKSSFNQDLQEAEFDRGITPKILPLQPNSNINNRSPVNQSLGSGVGSKFGTGSKVGTVARRNNSQKTSKEEEEKSYKESKRIRVNTRNGKESPDRKNKKNGKLRGESMKVRGNRKEDIPTLNFDSARFQSPYLDFLPGMKDSSQQQKTQRKQNISANKQKIQQIIKQYESIQTSNEHRNVE
ncbi:unnamed protein product [Paramecium primaurelia]|uniref:Transmembrane protein n=1 Tax=Paramecium primaurelia TaxID=5886 RepID=A0A8S1KXB3_PARPR|nr:unnamed protein product [Paramecium primaurelia]